MYLVVLPTLGPCESAPGRSPGLGIGQGFTFVAKHSGQAMAVLSGELKTASLSGNYNQHFRLEAFGGKYIGDFRILHLATGKYLTSAKTGGGLYLDKKNDEWGFQQFFLGDFNGKVVVFNKKSGGALAVDGASTSLGAKIVTEGFLNKDHCLWTIAQVSQGPQPAFVLGNILSGRAATEVGVEVRQRRWSEARGQHWRFEPLDGSDVGYYRVVNLNTERVLTVVGASKEVGARIGLADWSSGRHQMFCVVQRSDGEVSLAARHSKLVVGVEGESLEEDAQLVQAPWDDDRAHIRWRVGMLTLPLQSYTATFYEHYDYQGAAQALGPGLWDLDAMGMANDSLSSVRLSDGVRATLFKDRDFKGESREVDGDTPQLTDFNDKTSSILVELVATLYSEEKYKGTALRFGLGSHKSIDLLGLSITPSSLRVPRGLIVTLYEDRDFKGASWTFIADTPDLGAYNNKASSIVVEECGVRVPSRPLRFGGSLCLRSHHKKLLVARGGALKADSDQFGDNERFLVVRSGDTKYRSFVAFGDIISLRARDGRYVREAGGDARADSATIGDAERFQIVRVGDTNHIDFVSEDDQIALLAQSNSRYLVAEKSHDANVNRAQIGDYERWTIKNIERPADVSAPASMSVCSLELCGEDNCGVAACGAAGTIAGACGAAASGIAFCAADVCGAAVVGIGACGAAMCGVAVGGIGVCGADVCGAAACGMEATGVGACGVALGGISACAVDVAGVGACMLDFCIVDFCAIDLL